MNLDDGGGVHGFLSGAGEIGRDTAAVPWSDTPLGPPASWPLTLTTALRIMLSSRFSMWMAWGPELTFFCNEAYRRATLGKKYPWAIGRPAREVWKEIWPDIGPRIESVLRTGSATWDDTLMLFLERSGYREETYHTFSYSPLLDDGRPKGMLCVVTEETERALGQRRLATLTELSTQLAAADTESNVLTAVRHVMARHDRDLPFCAVYELRENGDPALLARSWSHDSRHDPVEWIRPYLERSARGEEVALEVPRGGAGSDVPLGGWDRPPDHAVLVPLRTGREGRTTRAFLAGCNPYRPFDDTAVGFARLVAESIAAALSTARAFEEERQRREALEDLDRVKTQFFANVSHEFRTPLTLIVGPVAELRTGLEMLGAEPLLEELRTVERNAGRLSKMVNALLDFSALQAERANARFQPLPLGTVTRELAEAFRSAIERAGLEFAVDVPDLSVPVYADPDLWEKVVLNLLSNALKFTLAGRIEVTQQLRDGKAVLSVRDTGVGIPEDEQQSVFERFHRSSAARTRSIEGSGIGLALVSEIAKLHGGTISVTSTPDVGSRFEVALPLGSEHLAAHQMDSGSTRTAATRTAAFITEAAGWDRSSERAPRPDPPHAGVERSSRPSQRRGGTVMVVEDNADMRAYITRVLSPEFTVRTVSDARAALSVLREEPIDLVLSDLMMPGMDGFELVRQIRAEEEMADLPVVLLTAHAGASEELRGLNMGADDYLLKPFKADELRGRVAARLAAGVERRERRAVAALVGELLRVRAPGEMVRFIHEFAADALGAAQTTLALEDISEARDRNDDVRLFHCPLQEPEHGFPSTLRRGSAWPMIEPLETGSPTVVEDLEDLAARFPVALAQLEASGYDALVSVPLVRATGEVNGSLTVLWEEGYEPGEADRALLARVAATVTDALERLRVADREHRLFVSFQEQLLNIEHRAPVGIVAARYRAASDLLMVGGDWFDVITLSESSLGLCIGDAVGKGIAAARVMALLRAAVGAAATSTSNEPAEVLRNVDTYADHLPGSLGATLGYLTVGPDVEISWASAGHPPPLLLQDGVASLLDHAAQPPLGAALSRDVPSTRRRVCGAAVVLLYTDGLVERRGESLEAGFARLVESAERWARLPVRSFVDHVLEDLEPAGGFSDDVAALAVRLPGADTRSLALSFSAVPANVREVRDRLRWWLRERCDEATASHVLLAVGEAVSNAVEHGTRDEPKGVVGVEVNVDENGEIVAAVTDGGTWLDGAETSGDPDRGRGLAIMRALMDTVEIDRGPLGSCITLRILSPRIMALRDEHQPMS